MALGRFTIWRKTFGPARQGEAYGTLQSAMIVGTYPGETEEEALEAMAKDEGDASFAASCKRRNLRRGHYDLLEVE